MNFLHKGIAIFFGSLLIAIGVNLFLVPAKLLDGGAVGIGLVSHYVTGVQIGLVVLLINIPIFVLSWYKNRSFFYNGLHGMILSSFMIDLFSPLQFSEWSTSASFINAILGGISVGIGIGGMLQRNISIGGTDLLGLLFARRHNINPGFTIFIIDFVIVFTGSLILGGDSLFMSCLTIFFVGITTSLMSSRIWSK
ncbi:hypothetical protein E2491_04945 [Jeotgalibacillus sp. R-1-5s-1]|nr:hypothetical protein E2491_04945 [Jeotgalibacillus sp. R-1-5s-1]